MVIVESTLRGKRNSSTTEKNLQLIPWLCNSLNFSRAASPSKAWESFYISLSTGLNTSEAVKLNFKFLGRQYMKIVQFTLCILIFTKTWKGEFFETEYRKEHREPQTHTGWTVTKTTAWGDVVGWSHRAVVTCGWMPCMPAGHISFSVSLTMGGMLAITVYTILVRKTGLRTFE